MDVEIRRQVDEAIGEADLLLFVVDAKVGLHPSDYHVADMLRNSGKPWMLVANKVDDPRATDFYEFYSLGVGEVVSRVGDQRQGLGRPARRDGQATAREPSRRPRTRCASR